MMKNDRIEQWNSFRRNEKADSWWTAPEPNVVEFIKSLPKGRDNRILDLGCGLGRHSIFCAKAGFAVLATDTSAEALERTRKWASEEKCNIELKCCDVFAQELDSYRFDAVVSYNVIYHGGRNEFKDAIEKIHRLLKQSGNVFFTCPTRQDGKYGYGEKIAENTYLCEKSITPGDIHYFTEESELKEIMKEYSEVRIMKDEGFWDNRGMKQFYSNFHVIGRR